MDDVSVCNSSSVELLINGDFESTPVTAGWMAGPVGSCGSSAGDDYSGCHSSNQCYYDACDGANITISQSFAATAGEDYNITFWYYHHNEAGGGSNPVRMNVIIS